MPNEETTKLEITQTSTVSGEKQRYFSPAEILARSAAFAVDKGTPVILALFVGFLGAIGAMYVRLQSHDYRIEQAEASAIRLDEDKVDQELYEANQRNINLQLKVLEELLKQGNESTQRIETYLLNSKE